MSARDPEQSPTIPIDGPGLPAPERLGRYAVVGRLGQGGMGEVLRVHDGRLQREVAAKVARGALDEDQLAKFVQEARIAGRLEHPGIVPVHDLDCDEDGRWFFTMKRVDGDDLGALIASGALSPGERLRVFLRLCEAVAFAHSRGVIHRDLKPANVMLGAFGEVAVCDWGLAKVLGEAEHVEPATARGDDLDVREPQRTAHGTILGTPAYMPPEQAEGRIAELDERSDVYSLGAILYELLTGAPPYDGATVWEVIEKVISAPVVRPSERADVPRELEAVVLRAMAFAPGDRYPSARALADDVTAYLDGRLLSAARYTAGQRLAKWIGRHRASLGAAALVLLVIAGAAVVSALRDRAARAAAIDRVRARLAALDPRSRLAAAEAALASAPTGAGEDPAVREHLSRELRPLRELAAVWDQWLRLAPEAAEPRGGQARTQLMLGRLALAAEELTLAEMTLARARTLGSRAAIADLRRVEQARVARDRRRLRRLEALLARAAAGELEAEQAGDDAYLAAMVELGGIRDPRVGRALLAELDRLTETLWRVTSGALGADKRPELAAALAAWRSQQQPAELAPASAASERSRASLRDVLVPALRAFGQREGAPAAEDGSPSWQVALALRQRAALAERGPGWATHSRLVFDGVVALSPPAEAARSLARYLWAEHSARRAIPAGLALARVGAVEPRAAAWLTELVTPHTGLARGTHFREGGPFWLRLRDALRRTTRRGEVAGDAASLLIEGKLLAARQEYRAAIAVLERAVRANPRSNEALRHRGEAHLNLGEAEKARADFDRVIALDGTRASGWALRGAARLQCDDVEGAMADVAQAIRLDPSNAAVWAVRCQIHLLRGKADEAMADILRATRLAPSWPKAHILRGRVHVQRHEYGRAVQAFGDALRTSPRNAEALGRRAAALHNLDRREEALADADRALSIRPMAETYALRGELRRLNTNLAGAAEDLAKARELKPRLHTAYIYEALLAVDRRDLRRALEFARQATKLAPSFATCWDVRGKVELAAGAVDDAILSHTRALQIQAHPATYYNRALCHRQRADWAAARADLDRAIAMNATSAFYWAMRGEVRTRLKDRAGALADYGRALECDPRHFQSLVNRAELLILAERPEEARTHLQRALAIDDTRWEPLAGMARVHAIRGNKAQAVVWLQRAIPLAPPAVQARLRRWMARYQK